MYGLGPTLYLPTGSSRRLSLLFTNPDGTAADLTGATIVEFFVKRSPWLTDADADLHLSLGAGVTITDAVGGIAAADITADQSAALVPTGEFFYFARAALADGSVIIPDGIRGSLFTDLTLALSQSATGAQVVTIPPSQGNVVLNRYDITGLTAGTVPLASIDISSLKASNPLIALFFPGSIYVLYRLRAKGVDSAAAPWRVLSTSDSAYLFELVQVTKEGAGCAWSAVDSKFYQRVASIVDGALVESLASTGFTLPA